MCSLHRGAQGTHRKWTHLLIVVSCQAVLNCTCERLATIAILGSVYNWHASLSLSWHLQCRQQGQYLAGQQGQIVIIMYWVASRYHLVRMPFEEEGATAYGHISARAVSVWDFGCLIVLV